MEEMKKLIVVVSIIIFICFIISSSFIIRIVAFFDGIVNVETIYNSPPGLGPTYATVLGRDTEGRSKGIWIKRKNIIFLEKVYSEYLEKGISEKDVIEILQVNNVQNISKIYLVFVSSQNGMYSDKDSIYWIATDVDNSFNEEYAIIDFYTGQIIDINTQDKGN